MYTLIILKSLYHIGLTVIYFVVPLLSQLLFSPLPVRLSLAMRLSLPCYFPSFSPFLSVKCFKPIPYMHTSLSLNLYVNALHTDSEVDLRVEQHRYPSLQHSQICHITLCPPSPHPSFPSPLASSSSAFSDLEKMRVL